MIVKETHFNTLKLESINIANDHKWLIQGPKHGLREENDGNLQSGDVYLLDSSASPRFQNG